MTDPLTTLTASLMTTLSNTGIQRFEEGSDIEESDLDTGIAVPPSTLGDAVGSQIPSEAAAFGTSLPIVVDPDPELGSNPIQALNLAPKLADKMSDRLEQLTYVANSAIQPMSASGTAMIVRKTANVRSAGPEMLDVLTSSHVFHVDQENRPERRLLGSMSYPLMDRSSILVDHRINQVGFGNVPGELATAILTLAHMDITNLRNRYRTMAYDTIRTGGKSQRRLSQDIHTAANQLAPWFTPSDWAPWADTGDALSSENARSVVAVVPHQYDQIQGDDINIITEHAAVDDAHILALFPLDTEWVESQLKQGGLEYVDEHIRAADNEIAYTWASMARDFGITEPIEKWQTIYDETLAPALEHSKIERHD